MNTNPNILYAPNIGEVFTYSYKYSFQGQEEDDEIKGVDGSMVNYTYRMHDTRIGRFFAVDPLAYSYAWNSPFAFSANRVVNSVEVEGLESEIRITSNWYANEIQKAYDSGNISESIRLTYRACQVGEGTLVVDENSPELNITSGGAIVVGFSDVRAHENLFTYFPELKTPADNQTANERQAVKVKAFYVEQSEMLGISIEYQKEAIENKKAEIQEAKDDFEETSSNVESGDNDGLGTGPSFGAYVMHQSKVVKLNDELQLMAQELESTVQKKEMLDDAIESGNLPLEWNPGSKVKAPSVPTTNDQDSNDPNKFVPEVVPSQKSKTP